MFWRVGVGVGVTALLGLVWGWDDVGSVVVLVLNQLTILIRFFKSPSPRLDVYSPFLTASNCATTRWHRACTSPVVTGCGGCIFPNEGIRDGGIVVLFPLYHISYL